MILTPAHIEVSVNLWLQEGWMDDLKALNLLVQSGSFGVLVLLVLWVIRFVPKRIEKADQLRELEAEAKKESARVFSESLNNAEKEQTQRLERLTASIKEMIQGLEISHSKNVERILSSHAEQLRYEREICEKNHVEIQVMLEESKKQTLDMTQKIFEILRDISHGVKDVQQTRANERAARKIQEQEKRLPGSK